MALKQKTPHVRPANRIGYAVNWPTALSLMALVAFIILIYREYQKHKRGDTEKEARRDVKKRKLTYADATYYQLADSLYQAFNVWPWGTEEKEVFRVMKLMRNQSDWNMLVSAFADRNGTLPAWLQWELNDGEMKQARKILKQNGITI